MALLLACRLPALLAGLAEDLTKQVGIKTRLLATATSGALAFLGLCIAGRVSTAYILCPTG